jgi:hypothetical protein
MSNMADFKAADGTVVTEDMINGWCDALDHDEWPEGWKNRSDIVYGKPPLSVGGTATLSIKVPVAMKQKIAAEAKRHGTSTSNYVRALLAEALLAE